MIHLEDIKILVVFRMNASPQQTKTEKGPLFEHTKRFNEKN